MHPSRLVTGLTKKYTRQSLIRCMRYSVATDDVLLEVKGNAGLITLNRPKALNALNLDMIRKMYPVIKKWEKSSDVQVIVMKGEGSKAFCAGGDVKGLALEGPGSESGKVFFYEEYLLNHVLGTLTTPIVSLISGITMGGGVGLSCHGHYRVASEKTLFAMPETAIGLFPDVGGGHFLPRLKGKLGLYLALTGFRLRGQDVFSSGIATHFTKLEHVPALEEKLLSLTNAGHDEVKDVLKEFHQPDPNHVFCLQDQLQTIDTIFSEPLLEDILVSLENDGSEWALTQLQTLGKMSPLSMKVTVKQLEEGAKMDLKEVLEMEYRLSQRFMEGVDFYEGIRAMLIDRDNNPNWQHTSVGEVTHAEVEAYFKRLPEERELIVES